MRAILERRGGVVLFHDTKQVTRKALAGVLADLETANCRRMASHQTPIVPVSLHYFAAPRMHRAPRIPRAVAQEREQYLRYLHSKCRELAAQSKVAVGQ